MPKINEFYEANLHYHSSYVINSGTIYYVERVCTELGRWEVREIDSVGEMGDVRVVDWDDFEVEGIFPEVGYYNICDHAFEYERFSTKQWQWSYRHGISGRCTGLISRESHCDLDGGMYATNMLKPSWPSMDKALVELTTGKANSRAINLHIALVKLYPGNSGIIVAFRGVYVGYLNTARKVRLAPSLAFLKQDIDQYLEVA